MKQKDIFKILNYKKIISIKPSFITITYNNFKVNKKIINYFLKINKKILPHIICKFNLHEFNLNINQYYINNIKTILLIKGDNAFSEKNYTYNFINIIKKNYFNIFIIYLGLYMDIHSNTLINFIEFKNFVIKNNNKNTFFISQYFYNFDSYSSFIDDLNKFNKKNKIIPGIMPIFNFKKIISFSNICKSELPCWLIRKYNLNINNIESKNTRFELTCNLIYKIFKFKTSYIHFYTMNNLNFSNNIFEILNNNFNF